MKNIQRLYKRRSRLLLAMLVVIICCTSFTSPHPVAEVVQGSVVDEITDKPVPFVHVYIVHGEEEALTDAKGNFSIRTNKVFPVLLTIEHKEYLALKRTIGSSGQKQIIRLVKKK